MTIHYTLREYSIRASDKFEILKAIAVIASLLGLPSIAAIVLNMMTSMLLVPLKIAIIVSPIIAYVASISTCSIYNYFNMAPTKDGYRL